MALAEFLAELDRLLDDAEQAFAAADDAPAPRPRGSNFSARKAAG